MSGSIGNDDLSYPCLMDVLLISQY